MSTKSTLLTPSNVLTNVLSNGFNNGAFSIAEAPEIKRILAEIANNDAKLVEHRQFLEVMAAKAIQGRGFNIEDGCYVYEALTAISEMAARAPPAGEK